MIPEGDGRIGDRPQHGAGNRLAAVVEDLDDRVDRRPQPPAEDLDDPPLALAGREPEVISTASPDYRPTAAWDALTAPQPEWNGYSDRQGEAAAEDAAAAGPAAGAASGQLEVLRLDKGNVPDQPRPQVAASEGDRPLQGVGGRLQHYYDRAWAADEARRGRLVVIGLKGLDRAAIEAAVKG